MNDELILNDYLMILKSTIEVYVHGTIESSNEHIRELLKFCLDETLKSQSSTYDTMVEFDYYCFNNVECNQIKKVLNNVNND